MTLGSGDRLHSQGRTKAQPVKVPIHLSGGRIPWPSYHPRWTETQLTAHGSSERLPNSNHPQGRAAIPRPDLLLYRRFIPRVSKIAHPLYTLTHKDTRFQWTEECQKAFGDLKTRLVEAPVLAYPNYQKDFMLETDASIAGLGAVLSQSQDDNQLHPVAYASRALSSAEKNYCITELETRAVVWAISHFHYYLFGHEVTVYTDHSAVKAILETPNPSGKHARWRTRVYSRGVKKVIINYRSGRENRSADALSRNPVLQYPGNPIAAEEVHVARVEGQSGAGNAGDSEIDDLQQADPCQDAQSLPDDFQSKQRKDPETLEIGAVH